MTLIDSSHFPAVRAAIDASISENEVPDTQIEYPIFWPAAEREVLVIVPDAADKTGDDLARVQAAVIYITAALIVPTLPPIVGANMDAASYGRRGSDVSATVADLRAKAARELALVLDSADETPGMPTVFTAATGTRGR